MDDAQMNPLTPELGSLLSADREIPAVSPATRARLSARLETSRRDDSGWRGPSNTDDELSHRRKWMRRGAIGAVVALAASVALVFALGGSGAQRQNALVQPKLPIIDNPVVHPPVHDRALMPSAARARRSRALRLQVVDSHTSRGVGGNAAAMQFIDSDAQAKKLGVFVDRDSWQAQGTTHHVRYLRTAATGVGPCTWTVTGTPGASGKCALTGREVIEAYLGELYKRRPDLEPDAKHELLFQRQSWGSGQSVWRTYYALRQIVIDGNDVKSAVVTNDPVSALATVLVELYPGAAKRFARITTAKTGSRLAIVVNGRVASAPVVQSAITGGRLSISMGGTDPVRMQREAKELVKMLVGAAP